MSKYVGININDNNILCCCKVKDNKLKNGLTIIVKDSKCIYFARIVKNELKSINNLEEYSPQEVATCIGERAKLMCKGDIRDDVTILVGRIVKTN